MKTPARFRLNSNAPLSPLPLNSALPALPWESGHRPFFRFFGPYATMGYVEIYGKPPRPNLVRHRGHPAGREGHARSNAAGAEFKGFSSALPPAGGGEGANAIILTSLNTYCIRVLKMKRGTFFARHFPCNRFLSYVWHKRHAPTRSGLRPIMRSRCQPDAKYSRISPL
jgi:hypothetical protein